MYYGYRKHTSCGILGPIANSPDEIYLSVVVYWVCCVCVCVLNCTGSCDISSVERNLSHKQLPS